MTDAFSRDTDKRAPSLARNAEQSTSQTSKGFSVAASPFNLVKRELGYFLAFALLLLFVVHRLTDDSLYQVLILLVFGTLAMLWLIWRTRQILRQQQATQGKTG